MVEENTQPYARSKPGDLWTAEIWNDTQIKIKEDIKTKVRELKDEINKNGVDLARDAEKFAGKSSQEWMNDSEKTYAEMFSQKRHYHIYESYFKRFNKNSSAFITNPVGVLRQTDAVITGHVGYIPQIEIYTLMGIKERFRVPDEYKIFSNDGMDAKFLLFRLPPLNEAGYEKRFYQEGFCYGLKYVLFEYGISFVESDTLNDVRSKLWKKLFTGRNDNISHASSQSIEEDCVKNVTIKTLMDNGHFNDIYFVFCPAKRNTFQNYAFFGSEKLTVGLESTNMKDDDIVDVMIIVRP